jgi:2-oxoglutarate dehydrogenase E2 component (dihydrolipoamide succinyltransferase)
MLIDVVVPAVGESISEVDIAQWRKAEGATVQRDDTLVVVETDKATLEIPAPESGILAKILKQNGASAAVGEVIGKIERGKVEDTNAGRKEDLRPAIPAANRESSGTQETSGNGSYPSEAEKEAEPISGISELEPAGESTSASAAYAPHGGGESHLAANEQTVPADSPLPPGVDDSHEALRPPPQASPSDETEEPFESPQQLEDSRGVPEPVELPARNGRKEEIVPMTALRRRIARRLVQAQQTAALLTTFNEIDMSKVTEIREQHGASFETKHNVRLGIMSFFVKAAVASLKASPEVNAEVRGEQVVYRSYYDIGIAVGGGKGLVVPVLRDAKHKSFAEIEKAIADFARRAREGRLNPEDLEGGTFTITNGGIYGSLLSTPIVNPPQTAILGMHAIQERPVARGGAVVVRPMMYVALTYDHRLVDGREAVSFLKHIKELVEEPARILFDI